MKKIFEIANEIKIPALELVDTFKKLNIPVRNHMSEISPEQEQLLLNHLKEESKALKERMRLDKEIEQRTLARLRGIAPQMAKNIPKIIKECQKCKKRTVANIHGKVSDMFDMNMGEFSYNGYVLEGLNIGGADYIEFDFCISCGQMQGKFPIDWKKIQSDNFSDDEDDE